MALIDGDDFVSGDLVSIEEENRIKNHWRQADPVANLGNPQPGMIVSDSDDEKLYHRHAASYAEIVQGDVPLSDEVAVIVGANSDGKFYYDEAANDEVVIEARAHADTEGVTVSLLETNQRFRIRQNSDLISIYLTTTDAYISWSDGNLILITDEGVNTATRVEIKGKGTGKGFLNVYDEDDNEFLSSSCDGGRGRIFTDGVSPSRIQMQFGVSQDVTFFESILSGNPDVEIYGWITAGGATQYGRLRMDDTNDEFEIEAEDDANVEGITVLIPEANQKFRVRGASRAERFSIGEDGLVDWARLGDLYQWTYQGDLADDATFNLPAFTDACWGFIQAGNNEEYALFTVDDDGDVILVANSANVVANADTDTNLCIGTAATQEPLVIKNRLGATKNINLIIWYS